EQQVLRQFLLDTEVPALHIAVACAAGNVANLRNRRAEVRGIDDPVGESLRGRAETGSCLRGGGAADPERGSLVDRRVDDVRSVVGQQILAARAIKQHPADSIGGTN